MTAENEKIKKYERLLQERPTAYVVTHLADLYLQNEDFKKAEALLNNYLKVYSSFSKIWMVAAKLDISRSEWHQAIERLETSVDLDPENILSHRLLADCALKVKDFKKALQANKMIFFLYPTDLKARSAIKRLEALTAEDYDDDLFETLGSKTWTRKETNQNEPSQQSSNSTQEHQNQNVSDLGKLDRYLSLLDAFLVRNDIEKAHLTLKDAIRELGAVEDLVNRQKLLEKRYQIYSSLNHAEEEEIQPVQNRHFETLKKKVEFLKNLKQNLNTFKQNKLREFFDSH